MTLACLQDLSQARHRWPDQADGFPSLFGTTVVLPGIGDVRTLDALSMLAGDEEIADPDGLAGPVGIGPSLVTDLVSWRPSTARRAVSRPNGGAGCRPT